MLAAIRKNKQNIFQVSTVIEICILEHRAGIYLVKSNIMIDEIIYEENKVTRATFQKCEVQSQP